MQALGFSYDVFVKCPKEEANSTVFWRLTAATCILADLANFGI